MEKNMKIGIYGGSFNPPHYGHENISKLIIKKLNLDKLIVIPIGTPCHGKTNLLDGNERYKLCELAFKEINKVKISRIEIDSDETSYTYDTLKKIIEKYGREHEYFEIIGEDSAAYFDEWKNYEKILELAKVVILKRRGYTSAIKSRNIIEIENDYYDISSSKIRESIMKEEDCEDFLKKEVLDYIKIKKLYK